MPGESAELLVLCIKQLVNACACQEITYSVRVGSLSVSTGPATIARLASGRPVVQHATTMLINLWRNHFSALDNTAFALLVDSLQLAVDLTETEATQTEVVWTGPKIEGSYLRATRQVVQDIIASSQAELLVVGYWLAGKGDGEGIVHDIVQLIAQARNRGVKVTMVLDEREKGYGKNNRDTLIALWPHEIALPSLLTWKIPSGDKHLKLHAKVLVADQHDALVTSANLTMYALDRNMEMGVRAKGQPSERIAQHFELLRQKEVLVPYEAA